MSTPSSQSGSGSGGSAARRAEEEVYDRYADQVLDGDLIDPEEFLAEHHPTAGVKLREALGKLYRSARSGSSSGGADALPFERLGEYQLIRRLGRGGMGVVFEAEQTSLGRKVALKLVRPELWDSSVAVERFRREVRTVANLRHPNIVTVHAAGEENGIGYLAMELIEGASLAELLKAGELETYPIATKLRWMADIARALHHAHEAGIVHRDVKPSNIRINADGRALLLDFGLVREENAAATLTDSFAGTPSYASPEQVTGSHGVDPRTDVYALGVTLYQCLTGRVPFEAPTVQALFQEILTATPAAPRKLVPAVPRDVEVATLHAIERNPAHRYPSAAAFADDLEAVLELRAIAARPPGPIVRIRQLVRRHRALATAAFTSILALAVIGGVTWWRAAERAAQDRRDARDLVLAARSEIRGYTRSLEETAEIAGTIRTIESQFGTAYVDPDEYAILDKHAARMADLHRSWDQTYFHVLDLLRRAEALDPSLAEDAHDVRVDLLMQRYREVLDNESYAAALPFRELARQAIGDRPLPEELLDYSEHTLLSDPPGAEVHLFRIDLLSSLIEGGPPRHVLTPVGEDAEPLPVGPDRWALLIEQAQGPLEVWDAIVEVAGSPIEDTVLVTRADPPLRPHDRLVQVGDRRVRDMGEAEDLIVAGEERTFVFLRGGERLELTGTGLSDWNAQLASPWDLVADPDRAPVRARVVRDRRLIELELPPGVHTDPCAAPPYLSARTRIGRTGESMRIQQGHWYYALLLLPGYEPLGIDFNTNSIVPDVAYPLLEEGTTPEGFVRIPIWTRPQELLWVGECEVTCEEYLEFLNQPETLEGIEASERPIRYPRMGGTIGAGPFWLTGEDGRYLLPDHWAPDWPVIGVSWHDAVAYCEWRTARARAQGLPHRYSLPEIVHRHEAAGLDRHYVWGMDFRPRWARSCFAYDRARPGRTRQFPVDRSIHGVYDLAGCALEWLDSWWDKNQDGRFLAGGAWGQGDVEVFKTGGGMGGSMTGSSGETGFRLRFELVEDE